jgi:AmmeMemoRadiSam system protein A
MSDVELSPAAREALLTLAYQTVCDFVLGRHLRHTPPADPQLAQHAGAFVTLSRQGDLRGCIGRIQADQPVWQVVQQMAISAAQNDPRFYPLGPDELDDLEVEISVLSPLRTISSIDEIEAGKHGLMITKGFHRGLLLPQVASERGWDRDTFLDATCEKAGLPPGTWRKGAIIEVFTAQVFGKTFGSHVAAHHTDAMK